MSVISKSLDIKPYQKTSRLLTYGKHLFDIKAYDVWKTPSDGKVSLIAVNVIDYHFHLLQYVN